MKDHFIKLFNYDRYANLLMAEVIIKTGTAQKPVQLMAHLLAAQQVWLSRCLDIPPPTDGLWPNWSADKFLAIIDDNNGRWLAYLEQLTPGDLDKTISYKNSKGESFENTLTDILAHVINHGTHHRAQAGQHLKQAGAGLPNTDLIFYIRGLNN